MVNRNDVFETFKTTLDHEVGCDYCKNHTNEIIEMGCIDEPRAFMCSECFVGNESILKCDTPSNDKDVLELQKKLVLSQFSFLYDQYFVHYEVFKDDPITLNKMCGFVRGEMEKLINTFDDFFMKGVKNERK